MNRRDFWSVITGGLLGARLGWFKPETHLIDATALDVESFRKFILDDERWMGIRKDIWSGKTDIGWSANRERFLIDE